MKPVYSRTLVLITCLTFGLSIPACKTLDSLLNKKDVAKTEKTEEKKEDIKADPEAKSEPDKKPEKKEVQNDKDKAKTKVGLKVKAKPANALKKEAPKKKEATTEPVKAAETEETTKYQPPMRGSPSSRVGGGSR